MSSKTETKKKKPAVKTEKKKVTPKKTRDTITLSSINPLTSTPADELSPNSFFAKTFTLLLILFLLHFLFTVYLFFKVNNLENKPTIPVTLGETTISPVPDSSIKKPTADEAWRGPKEARYFLIEYSDLECPFCKTIHASLDQVVTNTENVAWIFRHYPLVDIHPKAQKAAEAAECAGILSNDSVGDSSGYYYSGNPNDVKSGFWLMSDTIFDRMPDITEEQFPDVAAELGFNRLTFVDCLDTGRMINRVVGYANDAQGIGVTTTPTTYIYDNQTGESKKIEGAVPYEELKKNIDDFIAASNK